MQQNRSALPTDSRITHFSSSRVIKVVKYMKLAQPAFHTTHAKLQKRLQQPTMKKFEAPLPETK